MLFVLLLVVITAYKFIVMERSSTVWLLFISAFWPFALGSADFHLINLPKTYEDAKSHCREMYTDLVTVHDSEDMNNLTVLASNATDRAWIGLETGDVWMWHWSAPDQKVDFVNWKTGEPKNENQDACAAMDPGGKWFESDCGTARNFVCHGNTSGYIFVVEKKSWRKAQEHCRDLQSDVVSMQSTEDNEAVHNVSMSQNVWIGLFKDRWKWSDGSNSSFRYWKPNQPNYLRGQDCAAAIFKDDGKWNDLKCTSKRNFLCQGARKSITSATTQATSTQESRPTEQPPAYLTAMTANNSSPEVTVTLQINVATSTNQSNSTNVTTEEATTANKLTTNTTNFESNTSSAGLNNVTTTHPPPTATVNVTTSGVSVLTTLNGTSAQNTTLSSTVKPTENSQRGPSGKLILIEKNMTWTEAVSYCREHHIDLVHITTKDIQERVAEKAKKATSPHVWLGLRYTCNFNFWFWTSSSAGCYQNWAPGQGPDGKYDCGVAGAIESTGGHQWSGLPETERLNFICSACVG